MTIVYVVTEGEYSDYHILAVTADLPLATDLAARAKGRVEEYELMETLAEELHDLSLEACIAEDRSVEETDYTSGYTPGLDSPTWRPLACSVVVRADAVRNRVIVRVSGTDHERVRKVYSEQKARAIAWFDILIGAERVKPPTR
jgi:hypothetical protein